MRVFIDFWNFQLALKRQHGDVRLDWQKLGPWLTKEVGVLLATAGQPNNVQYEALHVYMSHNPANPKDAGLRKWAMSIDRFPGVEVTMKERRPKGPPECPVCYEQIDPCPHCQGSTRRTIEKGVDTALVTDMIRLAWEDAWDIAVLVSADADFIPAVEFLNKKGRKVIHAGFPPNGIHLSASCWASIGISKGVVELTRNF